MAKALKTIGTIAAAVALVATGVGAFAAPGTALAATAARVAGIASVVAGVANIGARLLTKPPPVRGSPADVVIDVEPGAAYCMGEGYFAGVLRHRVGYGATLDGVPNPYLLEVYALSRGGPIEGPIDVQFDFAAPSGWYSGFWGSDTRLGAQPDTALVPALDPSAPGWGSDYKLSGTACAALTFKFDKNGKRFASGLPARGFHAKWVRVYDPRKDDTQPGGVGAHRADDETTWEWSDNPALHAGSYALGRRENGVLTMGVGLDAAAIDFAAIAAWANDCEANGWRMFGVVFEPGDRWQNLTDICIAGGGRPLFAGGVLGFDWVRPRVPLATITEDDLVEGQNEVTAMQSWRDRINTLRPKYLSPAHNWSYVAAEAIVNATYLAEDGEERAEEISFNFVKDAGQCGQLAAYWLAQGRELTPITLTLGPQWRFYRPGECLRLEIAELGLSHDAVILRRRIDPATLAVTLTLASETAAKHAWALGQSATAPATPTIGQSGQERDEAASGAIDSLGARTLVSRDVDFPVTSDDSSISIAAFTGVLSDGATVNFPAATLGGLASSTVYAVIFDRALGAWQAVAAPATSALASRDNVFVQWQATSSAGSYPPPPTPPPGYGGSGDYYVP